LNRNISRSTNSLNNLNAALAHWHNSALLISGGHRPLSLPSAAAQNSRWPSPSADQSDQQKRPEATSSMLRNFCQENDRDLAVRPNPISDYADDVVIGRGRVLVRLCWSGWTRKEFLWMGSSRRARRDRTAGYVLSPTAASTYGET
jgi:hypothetical protein